MIVSLDLSVFSPDKEERLYWVGVLWKLIDEFDPNRPGLTNKDFHDWLYDTWKIKIVVSDENPNAISGIEIDDSAVSMLLLKYPLRKLSE